MVKVEALRRLKLLNCLQVKAFRRVFVLMTGGFGLVDDEIANPDLKQQRRVGFGGRMRRVQ